MIICKKIGSRKQYYVNNKKKKNWILNYDKGCSLCQFLRWLIKLITDQNDQERKLKKRVKYKTVDKRSYIRISKTQKKYIYIYKYLFKRKNTYNRI